MQSKKFLVLIIYLIFFIASIASLLFTGYSLKGIWEKEQQSKNPQEYRLTNNDKLSDSTVKRNNSVYIDEDLGLRNGEYYINDTVIILSKKQGNVALVATVTREQKYDASVTQISRASLFDGSKWIRRTNTESVPDLNIYPNDIVKNWRVQVDKAISLKQKAYGQLKFDETTISFSVDDIENEMPIRASIGYTKFFSTSPGKITIDGISYDANILYSRIYSSKPDEVLVYDDNFPFRTFWMILWDDEGNFYHADVTNLLRDVPNYASHSIGYKEKSGGEISKTFILDVKKIEEEKELYQYNFSDPVGVSIKLSGYANFDKYQVNYPWIMGIADADIIDSNGKNLKGRSIYEYIDNISD